MRMNYLNSGQKKGGGSGGCDAGLNVKATSRSRLLLTATETKIL